MGILAWIAIGIIVPIGGRLLARALAWSHDPPGIAAGLGGSILGGFLVDLTMRGDSVTRLNPATLVGALVGAAILLVVGYWLARPAATDRNAA